MVDIGFFPPISDCFIYLFFRIDKNISKYTSDLSHFEILSERRGRGSRGMVGSERKHAEVPHTTVRIEMLLLPFQIHWIKIQFMCMLVHLLLKVFPLPTQI